MTRAEHHDHLHEATPHSPPVIGEDSGAEKNPGAMIGLLALIVGLVWIAGCAAAALVLLGVDGVMALTPLEAGALGAGALLPALMAWFSGAAAREGARARADARRLADAADRLLSPAQSAELASKRLAVTVRSEITALDRALEQTIARLREVEGMIAKQTQAVDDMAGQAKAGAGHMITGMEREREELMKISRDLTGQAQLIGDSISRHTKGISDAARQAEAEVRAADQALDNRLTSFGAAAALINDRTHALSGAAQASADSALRLETALSNALDVLAKATSLTDAARQSAEQATIAANATAGAVRDTTARAIDDAKRVADLIRGEAVNVEREAAAALERLREAADAARSAAVGARTAIESERPLPRRAAPPQRAPEPEWRDEADDHFEPQQPQHRREPPPRRRGEENMFGEPPPRPAAPNVGAGWTWRDLLSNVDDGHTEPKRAEPPPRRAPPQVHPQDEDAVARLTRAVSDPHANAPTLPAADMIEHAGLRIHEVFSASGLDRIAQRSRSGTQARRRAVRDAAPDAVRRLSEHLSRDSHANMEAMEFLRSEGARIAELLGRGRAAMGSEATRAFLLIDAAAG